MFFEELYSIDKEKYCVACTGWINNMFEPLSRFVKLPWIIKASDISQIDVDDWKEIDYTEDIIAHMYDNETSFMRGGNDGSDDIIDDDIDERLREQGKIIVFRKLEGGKLPLPIVIRNDEIQDGDII